MHHHLDLDLKTPRKDQQELLQQALKVKQEQAQKE